MYLQGVQKRGIPLRNGKSWEIQHKCCWIGSKILTRSPFFETLCKYLFIYVRSNKMRIFVFIYINFYTNAHFPCH